MEGSEDWFTRTIQMQMQTQMEYKRVDKSKANTRKEIYASAVEVFLQDGRQWLSRQWEANANALKRMKNCLFLALTLALTFTLTLGWFTMKVRRMFENDVFRQRVFVLLKKNFVPSVFAFFQIINCRRITETRKRAKLHFAIAVRSRFTLHKPIPCYFIQAVENWILLLSSLTILIKSAILIKVDEPNPNQVIPCRYSRHN